MRLIVSGLCALVLLLAASTGFGEDGARLLSLDHYVRVKSTAPDIAGQAAQIYVREVVLAGMALRANPGPGRVVLFIHGAGTPAEVAFDVPYQDYSWMAYLARAGFDVFSMDMTGYGRSTRPPAMNDPCNLTREQQALYVPALIAAPCAPSYARQMTTLASDWHDIDAVVDQVRALRHVDKLSLSPGLWAGRARPDTPPSTRTKSRSWCCWRPPTIAPRERRLRRRCRPPVRR